MKKIIFEEKLIDFPNYANANKCKISKDNTMNTDNITKNKF